MDTEFLNPRVNYLGPKRKQISPEKEVENFRSTIPKVEEIESRKERDPDPGFKAEQIAAAEKELDVFQKDCQWNCCTFPCVKEKKLIQRIEKVKETLKKSGFKLPVIQEVIVDLMGLQADVMLANLKYGGPRYEIYGDIRACVDRFDSLLEVF